MLDFAEKVPPLHKAKPQGPGMPQVPPEMPSKVTSGRVPMSLRFRLISLIHLALVVRPAMGGATALVNAS